MTKDSAQNDESVRSALRPETGQRVLCAIPQLPSMDPFYSAQVTDPDSGASLRMYSGAEFGQDRYGTVHDVIWGKTLVSDNAMSIIFPA